jgi:hypothetical protein
VFLSRTIELAGGILTALLGLLICLHIVIKQESVPVAAKLSDYVIMFLVLGTPGVLVVISTYLQVIRHKPWAVALVFIAGVVNLFFVVLNAGLAYAFVQDVWGQRAVFANLVVVLVTLGTAFSNALVSMVSHNLHQMKSPGATAR